MSITAIQVKELRERTGAGMMDCKKALQETGGDIEAAIEAMRKAGIAKAAKKARRSATEGIIVVKLSSDQKQALMLEVNSETDFVARDENFKTFANNVAEVALANNATDVTIIADLKTNGQTIEEMRQGLITKLGENIQIRRAAIISSEQPIGVYIHGHHIGVLVELTSENVELGKDLAMHIVASNPQAISSADMPQSLIEKEKEIFIAQAQESGKPPKIIEKIIQGKINKFINENSLIGQNFVKDLDKTVGDLLKESGAEVKQFVRFEVGEGLEKKTQNFASEVMAQMRGENE